MTDEGHEALRTEGTAEAVRYRCTLCGNLTRFDVTERRRTRSFYHFTLGGLLRVENEEVLERDVEDVSCHWCSSSEHVEEVPALESTEPERSEG